MPLNVLNTQVQPVHQTTAFFYTFILFYIKKFILHEIIPLSVRQSLARKPVASEPYGQTPQFLAYSHSPFLRTRYDPKSKRPDRDLR